MPAPWAKCFEQKALAAMLRALLLACAFGTNDFFSSLGATAAGGVVLVRGVGGDCSCDCGRGGAGSNSPPPAALSSKGISTTVSLSPCLTVILCLGAPVG